MHLKLKSQSLSEHFRRPCNTVTQLKIIYAAIFRNIDLSFVYRTIGSSSHYSFSFTNVCSYYVHVLLDYIKFVSNFNISWDGSSYISLTM